MRLHPHAGQRMLERGASETEIAATIRDGSGFPPSSDARAFGAISGSAASGENPAMQ